MFVGQVAVIVYFVLRQGGPFDMAAAIHVVGGGLTISLSVIMGLPAVLLAALDRDPSVAHAVCRLSRAALDLLEEFPDRRRRAGRAGRRLGSAVARAGARGDAGLHGRGAEIGAGRRRAVAAGGRVLRRRADVGGDLRARLSLSRLVGIAAWASSARSCCRRWPGPSLHLQYDWFFFGEVFSIGLLLGYIRYRSNSTWLTIVMHGLNNYAATIQTIWLAAAADSLMS